MVARFAGTVPASLVGLSRLVVTLVPFHCTVEPFAKPEPLTAIVSCPLFAGALDGDIDEIVGIPHT